MEVMCKICGKVIPYLQNNVENVAYQMCEDCYNKHGKPSRHAINSIFDEWVEHIQSINKKTDDEQ